MVLTFESVEGNLKCSDSFFVCFSSFSKLKFSGILWLYQERITENVNFDIGHEKRLGQKHCNVQESSYKRLK